jgi:sec-independent protein translocase protein TatA
MKPGVLQVILIVLVLVLLFGAKRLPELARSIGKSLSEFKRGRQEGEHDADKPGDPPAPTG